MIDFTQKVSVPEDTLMRELEGESVLLNLTNEKYYGLNKVGTRMWNALEKAHPFKPHTTSLKPNTTWSRNACATILKN